MKELTTEEVTKVEMATIRLRDTFPVLNEREKKIQQLKFICKIWERRLSVVTDLRGQERQKRSMDAYT